MKPDPYKCQHAHLKFGGSALELRCAECEQRFAPVDERGNVDHMHRANLIWAPQTRNHPLKIPKLD